MKSRFFSTRVLLLVVSGILLLSAGLYYWSQNQSSTPVFQEMIVRRGDLDLSIQATGTVQPKNRLEIKAPVAGRIEKIMVKEGDLIKKGQILAWMSSTERAAMLDAARAKGIDEYRKWAELYLATPVMAPISGRLILKNVEPGQTFTISDAIFVISDQLTVKAQVDETDIAQIQLQGKAEIILDAYPQNVLPAVVDQIAFDATTVNNVTTYVVDVIPESTPDFMRSGMTANVTFQLESKKDVLLVPSEALKVTDGATQVLLKTKSSPQGVLTEIRTGLTSGQNTEVVEGLQEGDVVLSTQFKLEKKDGGASPFGMPSMPRRGRR